LKKEKKKREGEEEEKEGERRSRSYPDIPDWQFEPPTGSLRDSA
jgi:hypothetical protein